MHSDGFEYGIRLFTAPINHTKTSGIWGTTNCTDTGSKLSLLSKTTCKIWKRIQQLELYCIKHSTGTDVKSTWAHIDVDSYSGTTSVTDTGLTCQRWDSNSPHQHICTAADFPDANLAAASNYCRNPDGEPWPWCFTTDSNIRWEYCKLPDNPCRKQWQSHMKQFEQ